MKNNGKRILLSAFILTTLVCMGCKTAEDSNQEVKLPDSLTESMDVGENNGKLSTTDEISEDLAAGINTFGLNVFAGLPENGNLFFSPYSIATAFSILDVGAKGNTKEEIEEVLGITDLDKWSMEIQHFTSTEWSEDTRLLTANSIWADPKGSWSEHVKEDFFTPISFYYGCEVYEADFYNDLENVSNQITAWVDKNTGGMIKDYKSISNNSTTMSIINAVYFEGKWQNPFRGEDTQPDGIFRNGDGEWERNVPMMKQWDVNLRYFETEDFQGVELPYKDSSLVMDILLPKKSDITVYHNLSIEEQGMLWNQFHQAEEKKINTLWLPAFTMDLTIDDLSEILMDLGITSVFDSSKADLSTIGTGRYVSDVVHRAKIEICEEGTRAAAVTQIDMAESAVEMPETLDFIANHPFVYVIRDTETGIILFMGQVNSLK